MGRSKSKKKSSDFQKVKLKVGRSLPKGLNVTETKFKAKKLRVTGQYRPKTTETRTHRHQTIEDLLKKCQRDSVGIRHESFIDMGKLLNAHKELIELHLSPLLQVTSSGFLASSSSVRKEAINIFCLILENVSEVKISAFNSVLLPHICCAMTSINSDIRLDSLQILDVCLDAIPSVVTSSEKILQHFLTQISYEKNQQISHKGALKASLSQKSASERVRSQNWRVNVLCTLAKFLKSVNNFCSKKETDYFWPTFYSPLKIPPLNIKVAQFSNLKECFSDLMPILFEIWIEAAPIPYANSNSGEVVSADAATVMDSVLKVICLICEWIKIIDENNKNTDMMTWFNRYRKQIFGRLMVFFPYSQRITIGKGKQAAETEISCLSVNLAICDVFSMMPPVTSNTSTKLNQQITDYLLYLINRDNSGEVASLSILVKIVKKLLATSKLEFFEPHLTGLLMRYSDLEDGKKGREAFLDFVTDLVLDIRNKDFLEGMSIMEHLSHSLLLDVHKMHQHKKVVTHTIAVVKQLNVIGFPPFVQKIQENKYLLIEFFQSEEAEIQSLAVYLISRLTDIPVKFFHKLAKAVFNPTVQIKTISQLLSSLSLGLRRPLHIPAFTGKDYANFLFCIAVGMFKNEADTYAGLVETEQKKYRDIIPFHFSEYGISTSTNLQRHFEITQEAIKALLCFSDKKQICQCIHSYVLKFTTQCAHFPVHTGLALLLLEVEAYKLGYLPDDMDCVLCISEITIALFFYQLAWERDKEPNEIPSGSISGIHLSIIKILQNMRHVCEILGGRVTDNDSTEQIQCIGLILLIALRKQLIPPEDLNEVVIVMQALQELCGDSIVAEPWWISVSNEIMLPPYCGE